MNLILLTNYSKIDLPTSFVVLNILSIQHKIMGYFPFLAKLDNKEKVTYDYTSNIRTILYITSKSLDKSTSGLICSYQLTVKLSLSNCMMRVLSLYESSFN